MKPISEYDQGWIDSHKQLVNTLAQAIENEGLQYLTAKQAFGILKIGLQEDIEDVLNG